MGAYIMRVLVFGGAGFIGPRVLRRLVERGHEVTCLDINTAALAEFAGQVAIQRGDITRMDDVLRVMTASRPERVLNLAYLLANAGDADPHLGVRINILGMDNVFEAARLLDIRRVTYGSSIGVYGAQAHYGDGPVDEEATPHPLGHYSTSKVYNEAQAGWYNKAYGTRFVAVRPAHVTGPDKERGSVDHVHCITLPARGLPVRFPYADTMRQPLHVEDIAEVFVRVALADNPQHDRYNSGGETISLSDIAAIVRRYLPDAQIDFDHAEGGLASSACYLMDGSRLLNEFEIDYAPFPQRVLEIINDIRAEAGLPAVRE